ncbi:MAG: hypothetical protein CMH70_07870 [Nitrosomonadaceae bacterium]|nr:hypothetical protein [Nitrosomonadaceae bacterium]|tara:strand:- start:3993 stop:5267 length:1275 start_codon:yes stop_codon:yes gene_type:complete
MKALFFLRHYNDIDHITPVIYKWIESGHNCDVIMIGSKQFQNDYRIEFLRKLEGVRVAHIRELLQPLEFVMWRLQTLLLVGGIRRSLVGPLVSKLAEIYNAKKREYFWKKTAERLLLYSFEGISEGVVVFDWIERNSVISIEWVEKVILLAHKKRFRVVSLPHGDSPHANQLIRRQEWILKPDNTFAAAKMFDKLVVPNELCAGRFRPFLENKEIAVLGSPRYCDEWLAKLAEFLPESPLNLSDNKLKIAIFLRKKNFTTFWEEVSEVVQMIATFKDVEIIIKPHTRSGWKQSLTKEAALLKLSNVSIANNNTHSAHLLNWSDVIIDIATSVAFEAVKLNKPVLAADYLHAGRSTVANFMPETELKCRDDVYIKIQDFIANGCESFYIEEHRLRFLKEIIEVNGPVVLSQYVTLLEEQIRVKFT